MTLVDNITIPAGQTRRYLIENLPNIEKRFNLNLHWGNNAGAGTTARIMFTDIYDDANPDKVAALAAARGVTKPELFLDLNAAGTDRQHIFLCFPIYARRVWLEISVAGTALDNVTAYVQPISNTER